MIVKNKNNIRIAFGIVILSLFIAMIVGAGLIALFDIILPNLNSSRKSLLAMSISTIIIGLPVITYLWFKGLSITEHVRLNKISSNTFISIFLISIGFIIIIDELDRIIYSLFGAPEYLQEIIDQLKITSIYSGFIIIVTTAIIAPLVEEMLFRGYLQKVLEESWKDITKAILVTSLFFALIHLNPYWIVQIYLLGMLLGYLSWRTNSIIPGIILHGLNNGFAVALNNTEAVFNKYYNWHEHVNPLWIFIAIIFIIFGFKMLNKDLENQS